MASGTGKRKREDVDHSNLSAEDRHAQEAFRQANREASRRYYQKRKAQREAGNNLQAPPPVPATEDSADKFHQIFDRNPALLSYLKQNSSTSAFVVDKVPIAEELQGCEEALYTIQQDNDPADMYEFETTTDQQEMALKDLTNLPGVQLPEQSPSVPIAEELQDCEEALYTIQQDNDPANTYEFETATDQQETALKDLTNLPGVQLPEQSPSVVWANTYITKLPFIADPSDSTVNQVRQDEIHVRHLAETVLDAKTCDWISYLNYCDFASPHELSERVNSEIDQGHPVVIRGHPYDPCGLTSQELMQKLNIVPGTKFEVLDAAKRVENSGYPHVKMTVEEFCDGVNDTTRIQATLDCNAIYPSVPKFMTHVDQGHSAWYRQTTELFKREFIHTDVQKSSSWNIMHQPLYHTYAHHDADGYGTWTQILSGQKFWVFIRPKGYAQIQDRLQYHEKMIKYGSPTYNEKAGFYGDESERYVVFGEPGDIIVQPPGCFHEVYTPSPSVTNGGHFYRYETMHMTEIARYFDQRSEGHLTNQSHDSTRLTLNRMMAVLKLCPLIQTTIKSKALTAMCRMITESQEYTSYSLCDPESVALDVNPQKMPDVQAAQQYAVELIKLHRLDIRVWHYEYPKLKSKKKKSKRTAKKPTGVTKHPDFSFVQGSHFLDAGNVVVLYHGSVE